MLSMLQTTTPIQGLHALAPEPLPFAPSLEIRAFMLERSRGNILIYSTTGLRYTGAVSRQYLAHRHEASFVGEEPAAPVFAHRDDARSISKALHLRGTFSRRHVLDEDFEVIPIPGHTPGATAYLWDGGSHRFLFTGDSIFLRDGEWHTAVLESSDPAAYATSLELIRDLDFDVLVPWAAGTGQPYYAVTSAADRQRRIGALIAAVRAGNDH
jgi:hypothetical protein